MRSRRQPAGRGEFRPVYHPAGPDEQLRTVLDDLRVGRWMSMRDLLARTGKDWGLRTARSQVLAAGAARSAVVRVWLDEEPDSTDALMMAARVATARAQQAHRRRLPGAAELEAEAREACLEAVERLPLDPVPWVCLLALAQLDEAQTRPEHRAEPPEQLLPAGPWGLLRSCAERDAYNREAHHRVLQVCARLGGSRAHALNFSRWVASWAPRGSALLVLPLYAHVEHYLYERKRGRGDALAHRQWSRPDIARDAERALTGWFHQVAPVTRSVADLSHLAHALVAARRFDEAAPVFEAMGPHASLQPWSQVSSDPDRPELGEADFLRARAEALGRT
ncbi:hypothetical protein AB0M28_22760 [Streptomyces sp. NPDC051940]|uniref:hypothetical protein n=1 Tax=Streptomyces sp. NPDC051940 TaxID=3155675 RepID=UPI0034199C5A